MTSAEMYHCPSGYQVCHTTVPISEQIIIMRTIAAVTRPTL